MTKYSINVQDSEGTELTSATGSLGLVGYALGDVKETLQGAGSEKFEVVLRDEDRRDVITELTANGRTAYGVLNVELRQLRKQARDAANAQSVQAETGE